MGAVGTEDSASGLIIVVYVRSRDRRSVLLERRRVATMTVYPILLPDLARHRRVLLLPGRPGPRLVKALEACGVELHSYELKRRRRSASARFGAGLLRRCGVPAGRVAELVASGEALP